MAAICDSTGYAMLMVHHFVGRTWKNKTVNLL